MPVVLIVDDDAMMRELLQVLLEGQGYAVKCVDSGDAALALLSRSGNPSGPPGIVLTDVQMPGTAGTKLATQLRRICGPETVLLAMSGSGPPSEAISQFDGFLMKPFTMEEFAAASPGRSRRSRTAGTNAGKGRRRATPESSGRLLSSSKSRLISIDASAQPPASQPRAASRKSGMDAKRQQSRHGNTVISNSGRNGQALDERIYGQLAGSMPARQLREMYAMCLGDARERIATMRRLAAAGDGARFVREAHAIKGGCGMLGATELYGMAAALEKGGLARLETGAQKVNSLDKLADACDRLERILGSRA